MKRLFFATSVAAALGFAAYVSYAADSGASGRPPRPERAAGQMGPPPEALAACQGKAAGDKVSITLADGRVIAGSCQLLFRPDQPPAR